jgi:hypothetical protein
MTSSKARRIACYKEGIALAYCEVPLWEVTADTLPVLYDKYSTIVGAYGVNIFDEVFTAFQITRELPYRDIVHDEINKKMYKASMCAHRFVSKNGRSVDIQVPHICGCGIYPCYESSERLYCIFTMINGEIEVLSIDMLPLSIYKQGIAVCAAAWIANLFHDTANTLLDKHPDTHIKTFVEETFRCSPLFRICNARFLRQVALEDFKRYVIEQLWRAQ